MWSSFGHCSMMQDLTLGPGFNPILGRQIAAGANWSVLGHEGTFLKLYYCSWFSRVSP
jgi:hypothetical protein